MTAVIPFVFEGAQVRVVDRDGVNWFVAADVAKVLEIGRTDDAVRRLDDDEKGADTVRTPGGEQKLTIINESGLYSLILTSRKPAAKRFKRWVTGEVLPSLRRTGTYTVPAAETDDALAELAPLEELLPALRIVDMTRRLFGPARARAMWARLPLPPVPAADPSETRLLHHNEAARGAIDFMDEAIVDIPRAVLPSRTLYDAYRAYCRQNGVGQITQALFGRLLTDRGLRRAKSGIISYQDIGLRATPSDA